MNTIQEMVDRMNTHFADSDMLMKSRQTNRSRTQDKIAQGLKSELLAMGVLLTHNTAGFFEVFTGATSK